MSENASEAEHKGEIKARAQNSYKSIEKNNCHIKVDKNKNDCKKMKSVTQNHNGINENRGKGNG